MTLKKLQNIFRFQDDLLTLNDNGTFGLILNDIYPPEMVVNCTNISPRKCNYLDLTISIFRGKFRVALYDKRKDFKFKVISYPFLEGNIPNNLSYGVFTSQLIRFANINNTFNGFFNDSKELISKLVCQGFLLAALRKKFLKFYNYNINVWAKFGVAIYEDFINLF